MKLRSGTTIINKSTYTKTVKCLKKYVNQYSFSSTSLEYKYLKHILCKNMWNLEFKSNRGKNFIEIMNICIKNNKKGLTCYQVYDIYKIHRINYPDKEDKQLCHLLSGLIIDKWNIPKYKFSKLFYEYDYSYICEYDFNYIIDNNILYNTIFDHMGFEDKNKKNTFNNWVQKIC